MGFGMLSLRAWWPRLETERRELEDYTCFALEKTLTGFFPAEAYQDMGFSPAEMDEIRRYRRETAASNDFAPFRKYFRKDMHSSMVQNLARIGLLSDRVRPRSNGWESPCRPLTGASSSTSARAVRHAARNCRPTISGGPPASGPPGSRYVTRSSIQVRPSSSSRCRCSSAHTAVDLHVHEAIGRSHSRTNIRSAAARRARRCELEHGAAPS